MRGFFKLFASVFLAFCPVLSTAEENALASSKSRLMPLNTRVFDLGVDPESLRRDPDFIPLNRAPWLGELIRTDPVLNGAAFGVVAHIQGRPNAAERLWQFPGPGNIFKFSEGIPENLYIEEYQVQSASENHVYLLYIPKDQSEQFSVSCGVDRRTLSSFSFCGMAISYPPDPNIFIKVRIYSPEKIDDLGYGFRAIAQRVREIVYCLDVTDELHEISEYKSKDIGTLEGKQKNPIECRVSLPS